MLFVVSNGFFLRPGTTLDCIYGFFPPQIPGQKPGQKPGQESGQKSGPKIWEVRSLTGGAGCNDWFTCSFGFFFHPSS